MISKALFKRDLKISWKMFAIITGVMMLLMFALFFATSGMEGSGGMVIQQFYSLFASLMPVFYIGSTANKLIAAQIDNGSFAVVMSSPLKRRKVALTQACFLILSVLVMYLLFFLIGLIAFAIWGELVEMRLFLKLNFGCCLLNLAIAGIAYLATCLFNTSAKCTAIGIGVPLGFFLLYVVGTFFGSNKLLSYCKYLTINSLYNPTDILAGSSNVIWQLGILGVIALGLFIAGGVIFKKKDLPL